MCKIYIQNVSMKLHIAIYILFYFFSHLALGGDFKTKPKNEDPQEIIGPDSDPTLKGVKPDFIVEFRNSSVGTIRRPRLIGFNLGIKINARNRFGIGYSTLMYTAVKEVGLSATGEVIDQNEKGVFDATPAINSERNLFFYYGNFIYSHSWIQNQVLEFQTPFEIGYGKYCVDFKNNVINTNTSIADQNLANQNMKSDKDFLYRESTFVPVSISATLSLKLHTIVWPYANIGYRFVVGAPEFSNDFNGLFYNFGFAFDIFGIGKGFAGFFSKKS